MTAVASEGAPETRHRLQQRLRSTVLGPRGGGTTRRRASDAFRLALAIVVVLVSIPVMRANSAAELSIVRAVHPPPAAISWLVTSVFWLGSAGVIVLLIIVGLLVPRLTAVRWTAVAGLLTWGVCALLGVLLGSAAGRPPVDALAGLNTDYPVTQLAIAVAVAATVLPYLSRPMHRLVLLLLTLAVPAGVCSGQALPVNALSSVALGWGVAAGLHLAVGSPLGLPSAAEISAWITDLHLTVRDVTRAPRQVWGVEQFTGRDATGQAVELSVYGRDASDARVLAKLWRFCVYRDSGPTLVLDRLHQVEHEAYLTLMAGRAGVLVPEVLAAGRFGPSRDAALVTRVPDGPALSQADGGAGQRPALGHHRELGEDECQRHPSPARALDGVQGFAGVGENPDDQPDTDQRADGEQQVGPADPLGLRELGHLDAGPGGYGGPQPGKQILVVLERVYSAWIQRRALQVYQGGAGGIDVEHPGGRCGGALGPGPHGHRAQRGRQVAV